MSWQFCPDPASRDMHVADSIETVIVPRARDLGGFEVRRVLPSRTRQMVGPFIFFDQMGLPSSAFYRCEPWLPLCA
jgi:redox-sensitive bicupin YhaK (pirin superfamily)